MGFLGRARQRAVDALGVRLIDRVADSRRPDFVIGGTEWPYLLRWYVIPRNRWFNIYLHLFLRSDDDRALHSHPWRWNVSVLLSGSYTEVLPADPAVPAGETVSVVREQGDIKFRWGESYHRVELTKGAVWTLFLTGRNVREWGFACPKGFKHWRDFTAARDGEPGRVGPGCAE